MITTLHKLNEVILMTQQINKIFKNTSSVFNKKATIIKFKHFPKATQVQLLASRKWYADCP